MDKNKELKKQIEEILTLEEWKKVQHLSWEKASKNWEEMRKSLDDGGNFVNGEVGELLFRANLVMFMDMILCHLRVTETRLKNWKKYENGI